MFYKKGIDITNDKQMFNFLKGHFTYYTLNSWNCLRSIANNVKVYNLQLEGDPYTALSFLEEDDYFIINEMIHDFELDHKGYSVFFNGRSGGYLVLYNANDNKNVLPSIIEDSVDYEDYKEQCKYYYGSVKNARSVLVEYTKLVQDFDKLCDGLRVHTNYLSKLNFPTEKVHNDLDNFNEDFYSDLQNLNLNKPQLKENDGENISISIDNNMRRYRSLMECFFRAIKEDIWDILDDGSNIIRLEVK